MTAGAGRAVDRNGYRDVVVLDAAASGGASTRLAPLPGSDTDRG